VTSTPAGGPGPKITAVSFLSDEEAHRAALAATIGHLENTPVAIPYLLVSVRRCGQVGFYPQAVCAALVKHLPEEPPATAQQVKVEGRGDQPVVESPAAAFSRRMKLWADIDAEKQAKALRALPESELAVFEKFFRKMWTAADSCAYDRAVALRASALALAARGGAKADAEFVRSLEASLKKEQGARPADLEARLAALGSDDFAKREAEFKALVAMGVAAAPYVHAALASKDPEVVESARKIGEATGFVDLESELRLALKIVGAE
jgi:hypothetical protein